MGGGPSDRLRSAVPRPGHGSLYTGLGPPLSLPTCKIEAALFFKKLNGAVAPSNSPAKALFILSEMFFDSVNIYSTYGTSLVAFAAADAFVVVYRGAEIVDAYCFHGTGFDTFHAADAACFTLFTCLCTLVVVAAKNCRLGGVEGEQVDELSGTGSDTFFTGTAFVRIDSCHTVADKDSVVRAHLSAVTEADASVNAVFRTAEKLSSHFTGVNTTVFELVFYICSVTLTHYCGYHGSNLSD